MPPGSLLSTQFQTISPRRSSTHPSRLPGSFSRSAKTYGLSSHPAPNSSSLGRPSTAPGCFKTHKQTKERQQQGGRLGKRQAINSSVFPLLTDGKSVLRANRGKAPARGWMRWPPLASGCSDSGNGGTTTMLRQIGFGLVGAENAYFMSYCYYGSDLDD